MVLADDMSDEEFARTFEDLGLGPASFSHRNHVRLAWYNLGRWPLREAAHRTADSIRRFAEHHGATGKFHLTLTLAFMHLVHARMQEAAPGETFAEFCARNPELFKDAKGLIGRHYSDDALGNETARRSFVPPDREALPDRSRE